MSARKNPGPSLTVLAARLDGIELAHAKLAESVKLKDKDNRAAAALTARLQKRVNALDPEYVTMHLETLERDAAELHSRLQAMIQRITVATELSRLLGSGPNGDEMRRRLIHLFDKPDEFWAATTDYEIGQWLSYLRTGMWGPPISHGDLAA